MIYDDFEDYNVRQLQKEASRNESNLERETLHSSMSIYAVKPQVPDEDEGMDEEGSSQQQSPATRPPIQCFGCLGNHYRKDCPYREARCANCHQTGHIRIACRTLVRKNDAGQVVERVTMGNGNSRYEVRKPNSTEDQLRAAGGYNAKLADTYKQRSEKTSERRREKRLEEGLKV